MPTPPMKAIAILSLLFLVVPTASAQGHQFHFDAATGEGPFALVPQGFALARTAGSVDWRIHAAYANVTLVDDRDEDAIANPLNPNYNLVSYSNQTTTSFHLYEVELHWVSGNQSVSLFQGNGLGFLTVPGGLELQPVNDTTVERSHYVTKATLGAQNRHYAIQAPASVRANASMQAQVSGNITFYSWGNVIEIQDSNGTQTIRTGQYDDNPLTTGSLRSQHWAYAFIHVQGASANLSIPAGTLYSTNLQVASKGLLQIANATGQLQSKRGIAEATQSSLTATGGHFIFSPAGSEIIGQVVTPPEGVRGSVRALRPPWVPATSFVVILAVAVGTTAAPSVHGRHLRRRQGAHFAGFREDRCTAYSSWAAAADSRGWQGMACILFGRAVRNSPKDPEVRCEHAILLRQTGFPRRALKEHVRAAELLAQLGDPGCRAMNAYGASLCAARLGQDENAVEWLQEAVEQDPALMNDARAEPALRPLRGHPDFHAIVRAGA
ncbi:MAG: tetratricopeptide repeat protein [Thermoplasmatota archaeon]